MTYEEQVQDLAQQYPAAYDLGARAAKHILLTFNETVAESFRQLPAAARVAETLSIAYIESDEVNAILASIDGFEPGEYKAAAMAIDTVLGVEPVSERGVAA